MNRPSTSTAPSDSGGSGRSSTVAVAGLPGTRDRARIDAACLSVPVVQTPASTPPRSALLAAWGNAWLAGEAALTELVARVAAMDDDHTVTGLWVDDLP